MSIKSWLASVAKKREEKNRQKDIEYYKNLNIRTIQLDEDLTLYYVYNDGTTNKSEVLTIGKSKLPRIEKHKEYFYNDVVAIYDELFGTHQQCVENGKNILVWNVK